MIYAISDLHLSSLSNKTMTIFGKNWLNHSEKIKANWIKNIKPTDLILIAGDTS